MRACASVAALRLLTVTKSLSLGDSAFSHREPLAHGRGATLVCAYFQSRGRSRLPKQNANERQRNATELRVLYRVRSVKHQPCLIT